LFSFAVSARLYRTALACAPFIESIRTQFFFPTQKVRILLSEAYPNIRISFRECDSALRGWAQRLALFRHSCRGRSHSCLYSDGNSQGQQPAADYIEHLLAVLPERFADDLEADIDDLLPWADAMQKRFAMFGTGT
jgi:hypothetical protein